MGARDLFGSWPMLSPALLNNATVNSIFGLGCYTTALSDASGNILRYSPPTTDATLSDFTVSDGTTDDNLVKTLQMPLFERKALAFLMHRPTP